MFPTSGVKLLDQSAELDEETLPTYQPEKYYPVTQGEVLNGRYQTLAKLGYGVTSTVWLAKDLVYVQLIHMTLMMMEILIVYFEPVHRHMWF